MLLLLLLAGRRAPHLVVQDCVGGSADANRSSSSTAPTSNNSHRYVRRSWTRSRS